MDMEKFRRHGMKGKTIILRDEDGNEDTFIIKPLDFSYQEMIFRLMKKYQQAGVKDEMPEEEKSKRILEIMDKEGLEIIETLVTDTMKLSYPDLEESILKSFVTRNMMDIFPEVMELNSIMQDGQVKDANKPKSAELKGKEAKA